MAQLLDSLVLLAALLCYPTRAATAPDTIHPCSYVVGNVTNDDSYLAVVSDDLRNCSPSSWLPNGTNAFKVLSYSNATDTRYPLVIVARQEGAVVSWTVPFKPQGFLSPFNEASRTLCPIFLPETNETEAVYVDIFTSSPTSVQYNISVQPVPNYKLNLEETQSVTIGAATPQIHYFEFPSGADAVTIEAESHSTRCALISVQNNSCPANDLLKNARYKGLFQTMSTNGFLTVKANQVENRKLLIVMITTNFSVCHPGTYGQLEPINPTNAAVLGSDPAFEQTINITIRRLKPASHYIGAIFAPPLIFTGIFIVVLLLQCGCRYVPQWTWTWWWNWTKIGKEQEEKSTDQPEEQTSLVQQPVHSSPYGSTGSVAADVTESATPPASKQVVINQHSDVEDSTAFHKVEGDLKLSQMLQTDLKVLESQYTVYSWNTITVGIFYGLPAFQLVLAEQLLVNSSGNQDQCYYNFKCAHPVGVLSSFNNIWSNIGYVLLGALFLIIVAMREYSYRKLTEQDEDYARTYGVPQFFGIYYAMGIALILEGFMSSFYHICPSNANFQFDTAFMFIIGGLLLVKIFQNRHPKIHANAFIAFFSFAIVIFFTLLGIYFDRRDRVAIRITLFFMVMVLVLIFMVSFYHLHHWKCRCETLKKISHHLKDYFTTNPRKWSFKHKIRLIKLLIAFAINLFMAIIGMIKLNIPSAILALFLVNVLYFLLFYLILKVYYKEPWTILPFVLPLVAVVLWILSFFFYYTRISSWQLTPAESRRLNQECILFDFYDNHDVWHLLSACAIFTSFIFILTLDDGLAHTRRDKIHVF